jgi:hypothetical protein
MKIYLVLMLMLAIVLAAGCADSEIQEIKPTTDTDTAGIVANEADTVPPAKGSYDNPAGMNETIVMSSSGKLFEVSVTEVLRGSQADYIIYQENEFNEKAAPGDEYLLVKARVAYTEGSDSAYISSINFKAFSDGVERVESFVVVPNRYQKFPSGDVMPGGTKEGWLIYTAPQGKEVIMSYEPSFLDDSFYISLGST